MINNIFSFLFVYFYKDNHTDNVFRRNSIKLAHIGKYISCLLMFYVIQCIKHAKAARNMNLK